MQDSTRQSETVETINQEEKVSPNAVLIIRKNYKKCGHTTNDEAIIPEDMVNKTKNEVEEIYSNWTIQEFSKDKVVLYKQLDDICKEHYILRPLDNVIAVYRVNANDEEILEEKTGIAIQYLPQPDLLKLENGIKAVGKEQLNSILEDYE